MSKTLRRAGVIAAVTIVMLVALGGIWLSRPRSGATASVSGVLTDVQATSMIYAERVTVRDDYGDLWTFEVSPSVMQDPEKRQSAAHLRQHLAAVDPVRVIYVTTENGLLAVRILDGP